MHVGFSRNVGAPPRDRPLSVRLVGRVFKR